MFNQMQKTVLAVVGGLLALVVVIGGVSYGVYVSHYDGSVFGFVTGWLPVAKVDGQVIPYREYLVMADSGRTFVHSEAAKAQGVPATFGVDMQEASYERVIRIRVMDALAKEEGVAVSSKDVDAMAEQYLQKIDASSTHEQLVVEFQKNFGWTEDQFKNLVMRPALVEQALIQKYTSSGKTQDDFDAIVAGRMSDAYVKRYFHFPQAVASDASVTGT